MGLLYKVIDGVNVCSECGQEVCDCGSGLMHDMEPEDVKEIFDDFTEAAFDGEDMGGDW